MRIAIITFVTRADDHDDVRPTLRLGHSPDPDDAFMWWPLFELEGGQPRVCSKRFRFVQVAADIETLNLLSEARDQTSEIRSWNSENSSTAIADSVSPSHRLTVSSSQALEITAISCAQYPHVQDRYVLTACGASMGEGYGPKLIARAPMSVDELRRRNVVIAVPGERTSAFAATVMRIGQHFRYEIVPFEQIIERVADGTYEAGLVIHEGQLTFARRESGSLHLIEDLGAWWWKEHHLPLPLGVNVVRRDLEELYGRGTLQEITALLLRSVEYALAHREESIAYALQYARGLASEDADAFIGMYVNKWTLNFGEMGLTAVERFLNVSHQMGNTPPVQVIESVQAAVL